MDTDAGIYASLLAELSAISITLTGMGARTSLGVSHHKISLVQLLMNIMNTKFILSTMTMTRSDQSNIIVLFCCYYY